MNRGSSRGGGKSDFKHVALDYDQFSTTLKSNKTTITITSSLDHHELN